MTVKTIVKDWLRKHRYGGLWCERCGCDLDDLMECKECAHGCQPGYKVNSRDGWGYHIVARKPRRSHAKPDRP